MSNRSRSRKNNGLGFRNVVRLGYVSLFTDVSTEMILGVLPLFIVRDLGATAAILGLIEGTSEAVNDLFRVIAGLFTDRIGRRKPLVLVGYGLSSIAKPLFAVASSWSQAFVVRVVDRAGKGTRTSPRDALISDSIPETQAGKAFGLHRSLDQIGAVVGPFLAFVAIPFIGVRGVFWVSFLPAVVALVILLFFVSDIQGSIAQQNVFRNARSVLNREFILLLVVLELFSMGAYNYSFILLKAGLLGIQENNIALVYATLNLATVVLGLPAGILADRVGKMPMLFVSYIVFVISSIAGFMLIGVWAYAFLIAFLYGSYLSISDTVQRALIPDFTTPEMKGTGYAIYYALIGLGSLVANSVFGSLWSNLGPTAAFQYSIITSTIALVALLIFMLVAKPERFTSAK
jgi:MFS family permease